MVSSGLFRLRASVVAPKTTSYSRYIGRVGALAVALGIGAAVGTWPAVAFAEPTDSETSTTPADSTSQPADATPKPANTVPTPTPAEPTGAQPSDPIPSIPDPRDGIVQAGGGAEVRTSSDLTPPVLKDDETASPEHKHDKRNNDAPPEGTVSPPAHPFTESKAQQVESTGTQATPTASLRTNTTAPESISQTIAPTAINQDALKPTAIVHAEAPADEPHGLIASVIAGLAAAFSPLATNDQGAPMDSPLAWGVLALTRRWAADPSESGDAAPRAFSTSAATNQPPVAAQGGGAVFDPATGVLSGTLNFVDPDGDPLVYYVLHNGLKGNVVYKQDGTFTYTPTQAARLVAAQTAGPDQDGFALGASDGTDDGNTYFYAPVSPAQFALTTPLSGLDQPVEVAFSPDGSRAYLTTFGDHSVQVIDTTNNTVLAPIDVNTSPIGIALSPDGSRAYTINATGGLAVIDTANDSAGGISFASGPGYVAVTPDGTRAYVTNWTNDTVSVIDLASNRLLQTIPGFHVPTHVAAAPDGTRVFVTNVANGPGEISVIDTATNAVVDTIRLAPPNSGSNPYGFAFSADGSRMYVADAGLDNITVLDTSDYSVVDTIAGITNPTALAVSPDGSLVYVAGGQTDAVTVIDTATHGLLATYQFNDTPSRLAVSPDGNQIYIVRSNGSAMSLLTLGAKINHVPVAGTPTVGSADPVTGAVSGRVNFTDPDGDPLTYSVAVRPDKGSLVVSFDGSFVYTPTEAARLAAHNTPGLDLDSFTIAASDGSVSASVAISPTIDAARFVLSTPDGTAGGPSSIAFSPDGGRAYVAAFHDNAIKVYDTSTNALVASIPLNGASEGVAASPDGTRAYAAIAQGGIAIIDTSTNTVVNTIPGSPGPVRIALTPNGTHAFVTNYSLNTVSVIDLTNDTVVEDIPGFNSPLDLVIGRDGTRAYVANVGNGPGSVMVIDTATNTVVHTIVDGPITSGFQPYGFAVSPDGTRLYIGDVSRSQVTIVDTATNTVIDHIGGLNNPTDIALSPDGSVLYAPNQGDDTVSVIDVATGAVLATFAFGDHPYKLAANPNGTQVFIGRTNADALSVLTLVADQLNHAPVAGIPTYSAPDPVTGAVVVTTSFTDPDGDPLTYAIAVTPTHGIVVINPDGTFTYTPTPTARHDAAADNAALSTRLDSFIITASDGTAETSEYAQLAVSPLNHAPTPAGSLTTVPGLTNVASDFVMSADGSRAYVELSDPDTNARSLAMIDTATNTFTVVPLHGDGDLNGGVAPFATIVVSANGRYIYDAGSDNGVYILDVIDTQTGTATKVSFLNNGQLQVSGDGLHVYGLSSTGVSIFDATNNQVADVVLPYSVYKALTLRPDGAGVVVTNVESRNIPDAYLFEYAADVIDNDGTLTRHLLPGNVNTFTKATTISPDGTHVYIATYQTGQGGGATGNNFLTVIDIPSGTSHDVAFAGDPRVTSALTVSPDGTLLYAVVDHHTLGILDADGNAVAFVELGGTYFAATVAPDGQHLYLTGNPNGDAVYTGAPPPSSSSLAIVDLLTKLVTTVPLASPGYHVSFSPDGSYAFVAPAYSNDPNQAISIVDTATDTVRLSHIVGGYPADFAVSADSRYASLLAFRADGSALIVTVDTTTSTVTSTDLPGQLDWPTEGFTGDGQHFYEHVYDEHPDGSYDLYVASLTIPAGASTGVRIGTPAAGTGVVAGTIHYSDIDSDTLIYSVQTGPGRGTVTIDPTTGGFSYTPDGLNTSATSTSFTVIVDDGHGAMVPVTVTVPIAAPNAAPTVTIRPIAGDYATGIVTYEAAGTDPDGDPLTYTVSTEPTQGTVVNNGDGTFTFTPTAAARHAASADNATYPDKWDTFVVTVTDPSGATGEATATAMISPANVAPQPSRSAAESVYGDPSITMFTDFRDDDQDAMTFAITGGTKGNVTPIGNGNFIFTPTPDAQHAAASPTAAPADKYETVTVVANDGHGGVTTRTYDMYVLPKNTAPTVTLTQLGGTNTTTGAVTYQAVGTDPDDDALSYSITANPTKGSLVRNTDGIYTYTPTPTARHDAALTSATDAQKQDTFTITATDGYGGSTATTAILTISTRNSAPTASLTQVGAVNATTGAAIFRLTGSDTDGDPVAYSVSVDPSRGTVVRNTNGTYTFTPTAAARHDAALTDATADQKQGTFTITADDAHGGVTAATATAPLTPKNTRPTVSLALVGTPDAATGAVTYRINGIDADGDQLSYSVGTNPGKGGVVVNTDGTLTYTPTDAARHAASATGATTALKRDTFTVVANDAHGGTATSTTVTVTVNPRNAAPAVTLNQVGTADPTTGAVTYRADGIDADGDALTYTISTRPTKGALVANGDGTFTYTATATAQHAASADAATPAQLKDTFTITANDAHGSTTPASATATISPKNSAPAVGITQVGSPNRTTGALTYRVIATDADRDTPTYTVTTDPSKGMLVRNANGTYTYTPTADARHDAAALSATDDQMQDTFAITTNDAHGSTVVTSVIATISPKNTAPTATPTVGTTSAAGIVTGTVGGGDADGDPLSYAVTTGPGKGSVMIDGSGAFTYTPSAIAQHTASADSAPAADKRDTFTVTVTDAHGGTKAVAITAQVLPKNTGPGVTPAASSPTIDSGAVTGSVGGSDGDNDTLAYAVSTRPGKGTLMLNPDGTFTYTPAAAARTTASRPTATAAQKQDTFAIRVKDGHGGTVVVTYTVPLSLTTSGPVVISANPQSQV